MVTGYVAALAITVAVETPLYAAGLRRIGTPPPAWRRAAFAGAAVNLVSHPVGWLVLWPLLEPRVGAFPAFAVLEAVVVVGEWAALCRWLRPLPSGDRRAALLVLALVANAASMAAGVALVAA